MGWIGLYGKVTIMVLGLQDSGNPRIRDSLGVSEAPGPGVLAAIYEDECELLLQLIWK